MILSQIVSTVGRVSLFQEHIANIRDWAERELSAIIPWIATLGSAKQSEHTLEAVIASVTEPDPELTFLLTGGSSDQCPGQTVAQP